MAFVHSQFVQPLPLSSSGMFSSPQRESPTHEAAGPHFPPHPQPRQPAARTRALHICLLGIACEWTHVPCDLLGAWLPSLSILLSRLVHVVACVIPIPSRLTAPHCVYVPQKDLCEYLFPGLFGRFLAVQSMGRCHNSVLNFLKNHQTLFHSSWTILCFHSVQRLRFLHTLANTCFLFFSS